MLEARPEGWWTRWSFRDTTKFIVENGFTQAALQFPDELLADSITVASDLQESLNALGHTAEVMRFSRKNCTTIQGYSVLESV